MNVSHTSLDRHFLCRCWLEMEVVSVRKSGWSSLCNDLMTNLHRCFYEQALISILNEHLALSHKFQGPTGKQFIFRIAGKSFYMGFSC